MIGSAAVWERIRKPVVTAALLLFALYELAAFWDLRSGKPVFHETFGPIFWPATWKMFTGYSHRHQLLEFQGLRDGEWHALPMKRWYPMRWDSGYRWERPRVRISHSTQAAFLEAACRHTDDPEVRLVVFQWKKRLGRWDERPPRRARMRVLSTWHCGDRRLMPRGMVL
jgi:hypothetical protein